MCAETKIAQQNPNIFAAAALSRQTPDCRLKTTNAPKTPDSASGAKAAKVRPATPRPSQTADKNT